MQSLSNIEHRLRRLRTAVTGTATGLDLRTYLTIAIACAVVMLMFTRIGGAFLFLHESRNTALRNAQAEIERSTRLAAANLNRQILQVDSALASLPALLSVDAAPADAAQLQARAARVLLGLNFQASANRDLMLISKSGEVWAAARPRARRRPPPIDLAALQPEKGAMRIAGPVRSPATGEWSIFLARQVHVAGAGDMHAIAEVAVSAITTPLAEIADKHGYRIFIERDDGRVVASIPHDEALIGATRHRPAAGADGAAPIEAERHTLYPDLHLVMQVDTQAALVDWVRDRDKLFLWAGLTGLVAILISVGLLAVLLARARKDAAQNQALSMLEDAVEAMPDGFVMWDGEDRLVACNSSYRQLYKNSASFIKTGATFEEVIRGGVAAGQYPQAGSDTEGFVRGLVEWHRAAQGSFERLLPDGRWILVTERRTKSGGTVGIRTDITRLKQTLNELAEANARVRETMSSLQLHNEALRDRDHTLRTQYQLFDTALNNMSHGLLMVDPQQRVIVCNRRFRDIFNLAPDARLNGMNVHEAIARQCKDFDQASITEIKRRQDKLSAARENGTFVVHTQNGHAIAITQRPTLDGGFVAIYEDVTEQTRAESRIRYLAHHDSLTTLPNRVMFRANLEGMIASLAPGRQKLALLYLDLDRFKDVNDTLGHQTGDALLEVVGQRLRNCLREGDAVARLGGDEFAVALVSDNAEGAAAALAERVIEQLSRPYGLARQVVTVGVSVGIAIVGEPDIDVDTALKCADMALYRAKDNGRGQFCIFEPEMEAELRSRLMIEHDLKQALANGEFRLAYQPLIDLSEGRIIGHEALLRWDCTARGTIPPAEFIPLAEEMDIIGDIGAWCLEEACRNLAVWQGDTKIAVNLSPVQLRDDDIVEAVRSALATSGLDPGRLELEITESALLEDSEQIVARLHRLHALGVRIVLDDFGTGFSSLNYLRCFPFDKIKIDKVFVTEATTRPDCEAIVRSVVELAGRLGMATTAEGIETPEQLDLVRRLGCDVGQGYLFGKPVSIFAALAGLEAQRRGEARQAGGTAAAV
ncbi:MAG: EAL domain-containing protein [Hyphomicrobiaceae bacterium]|nr:EAL domain-containing protein [Hyphomicrobiaceae bacterium]